ncbi:hypothetical protein ACFU44_00290 [Nocardia rhizosphaerihabitans]|uniref:LtfC-like domain-containing protein n=1 Tax=Nocardia rhizosphaerihabitans TaxID=1691570 RepID=UPI0036703C65
MAGREAKNEPLKLIVNDDFEYTYEWKVDGVSTPFPANHELYYQFQNGSGGSWTGGTKWQYVIDGALATLRIESEVANAVPDRMPYQLIFKHVTDSPTKEKVLLQGFVSRQVPR